MTNDNGMKHFCLGLGIGVAAAVLFAPRSGSDSRRILRTKAQEGADYLKQQSQDLANNANQVVEKGMRTVRQQTENVMAAVDAGRSAYREALATTPSMNGV